MGTIIKKKIKGNNYYYYVESKRINGKPKYVNQRYLGTAEKIVAKALESGKSLQEKVLYANEVSFGAVALLYDFAMKLGIVDLIDEIIPKRKQGVSVGMYILIAAINRAASPTSKRGLQDWYRTTALPFITGCRDTSFTPQNFWNNTDVTVEQLRTIEDRILQRMVDCHGVNVSNLIYDATNFFTYIDTMNPAELAKRGHDKAKRNDLKTVGLSLTVTPDYSIPIISETYPGNRNDARQFADMMRQMQERLRRIVGQNTEITLVFDRGNNSESNLDLLYEEWLRFHYVGGLKKNQVPELFQVNKNDYKPLDIPTGMDTKLSNLTSYRMKARVFNRDVTAIVVHNPALEQGQLQGILLNIKKTKDDLLALQTRLLKRARGEIRIGKKPTVESVRDKVNTILKHREFMKDIFNYEIFEKNGQVLLTFADSDLKLNALREDQLGKTALFTDRDDLSDYQIIKAYRSAWHVEHSFKQMKDTNFLTVRPIFHWTDQKIAIHIFICVLAYRLCALLRKELHDNGITCTINQYLQSMGAINRVTTFYGNIEKPEKIEAFITGDDLAKRIENLYQLQKKYYG